MPNSDPSDNLDYEQLTLDIKRWGLELGFQQVGITDLELKADETHLLNWLKDNMHGEMDYMQRHGVRRSRPQSLVPGTVCIISLRMDYFPPDAKHPKAVLGQPEKAYISRYALGRDYHKVLRKRIQQLADQIEQTAGSFGYRAFVDSAPVLEKALARNAGLGWIGKHSNLINPKAGSWFFLGELYTDLPLITDGPFNKEHCGSCNACIDICPTNAIIAPYKVDARKCISYLTIELRTSIPIQYRKMIGNRIYGCDDCQLVCPWNKFAHNTEENDFRVRNELDTPSLIELFEWDEDKFLRRTEGSAIRRIGYTCWLRNIAVALGNAPYSTTIVESLKSKLEYPSAMVREHVLWALEQQINRISKG